MIVVPPAINPNPTPTDAETCATTELAPLAGISNRTPSKVIFSPVRHPDGLLIAISPLAWSTSDTEAFPEPQVSLTVIPLDVVLEIVTPS